MYDHDFVPQGWQCPVCRRVYSPSTPMCFSCGGERQTVTTTGTTIYPGYMPPFEDWNNTTTGTKEAEHEQDELH